MRIVADPRGVYESISKSDPILTANIQVVNIVNTHDRGEQLSV